MPPADISATPFWQKDEPLRRSVATQVPPTVDVLVIGAGYTGLSAAHETAAAGIDTWVIDAGEVGTGCSGRNGGQVAYSIKPSFDQLSGRYGADVARAVCRVGLDAVSYLRALATDSRYDCGWRAAGTFVGAHTRRHFTQLAREAGSQPPGLEQRIRMITKAEQHTEIASDFYHGGCVYLDDASVDPMKLLRVLERRAQDAGARIAERCAATRLERVADGFLVTTGQGQVRARKVLLATNGYSGALSPWHRRRMIPIGSYQIATQPLGSEVVSELIPHARNISDTRRVVVYYRPSPDGTRIIFGGRAALAEKNPLACVDRLCTMMSRIFPQLRDVPVSHAWVGWVGYTFDTLPHVGEDRGLFHAMGYCGQGVPMAPFLGCLIGRRIAELPDGKTGLDSLGFPSRPYYYGKPWFLAPSVFAYRTLDSIGI